MTETFNDAELAAQNQFLKGKVAQLESSLSNLGKSYQGAVDAHSRFNHSLKVAVAALREYQKDDRGAGIDVGWADEALDVIKEVHRGHEVLTP